MTFGDSTERGIHAGRIASAPASLGDEVDVILPELDNGVHHFGPARWMTRGDSEAVPSVGDECVVAYDDAGALWVVAWWPATAGALPSGGGGGGDATHVHDQSSASSIWTIAHALGKYPSVTVVDTGGSIIMGDVSYPSVSQVAVEFTSATSGKAYLN